jgi:hypothetical protein
MSTPLEPGQDAGAGPAEFIRCEWQHKPAELAATHADFIAAHRGHGPGNMGDCDTFLCVPECGNNTSSDGFFPCRADGSESDDAGEGLYRCGGCKRIIEQATGRVVGRVLDGGQG